MKIIHAKFVLIVDIWLSVILGIIFISFGVDEFGTGDIKAGIFWIIVSITFILVGIFLGMRVYFTHWIQYGNGRVVIRRVSKEIVNGRVVGKWKIREDEILLEDIVAYGLSWQVLGHYVEYHFSNRRVTTEVFFQLKDGKRIGYEAVCYLDKGLQELYRYIYEGTGLEFQKSKPE